MKCESCGIERIENYEPGCLEVICGCGHWIAGEGDFDTAHLVGTKMVGTVVGADGITRVPAPAKENRPDYKSDNVPF